MSKDHKEALAVGRAEGRLVRAYLEALEMSKPKRGRKRTKDTIGARLERIDEELESSDPLRRLQLVQERIDLNEELSTMDQGVDIDELEKEFTRVAKGYAERKGITYAAFRQIGVSAAVLKRAGISRAA
ncbi:MAG: hypothetical protein AAF962_16085 [Actinomycetota bacterium]